jgi:Lamin Tail Domain
VELLDSERQFDEDSKLVTDVDDTSGLGGKDMKRFLWVGFSTLALTLGCSDGTETGQTTGTSGKTPWVPAKLVINEMHAVTEDWIEVLNADTVDADLSGVGLTDKNATGVPDAIDAVRFLEGSKLAPGEFLIVVANVSTAMPGIQTTCLMTGGPATCYQAKWGISSTNGDKVYLLSPTDDVVDVATYPVNAVLDGQSYCRLPNGTGDFAPCAPTPAAANAAP